MDETKRDRPVHPLIGLGLGLGLGFVIPGIIIIVLSIVIIYYYFVCPLVNSVRHELQR